MWGDNAKRTNGIFEKLCYTLKYMIEMDPKDLLD